MKKTAETIKGILPELKLILLLVGFSSEKEKENAIGSLDGEIIDWELFIKLAGRHRVPSAVFRAIQKLGRNPIPPDVLVHLKTLAANDLRRILVKTTELVKIIRELEKESICALAFKGPIAGILAYGNPCERHVGDLDIMVPVGHVEKAGEVLSQLGYERALPRLGVTKMQNALYRRNNSHYDYFCEKKKIKVELHYRTGFNRALFPLTFQEAWDQRQMLQIGDATIPTFSLEHTLMLLCVHGCAHGWFRLFWLLDVARLFISLTVGEWDRFLDHADRLGISRMVSEAITLAEYLLGISLPNKVIRHCQNDRTVDHLVDVARERILSMEDFPDVPMNLAYIKKKRYESCLRSDTEYKLKYLLYQIGPSHDEWEMGRLPEILFFLYFFFKPFSLMNRWHVSKKKRLLRVSSPC